MRPHTPHTHTHYKQSKRQRSARCTLCTPVPSTPPDSMRACRLDEDPKPPTARLTTKSLWTRLPRGLDAVAPAPRPRSNSAHPDAHHPRPASQRPLTPPSPPRAPTRGHSDRRNPCNAGPVAAAPILWSRCHAHTPMHQRPPDPGPRTPPPQRWRGPARRRTAPRPRAWHDNDMLSPFGSGSSSTRKPCG